MNKTNMFTDKTKRIDTDGNQYFSVMDVARLFDVSETTVRKMISSGRLKTIKTRRYNMIYPESIDKYTRLYGKPKTINNIHGGKYG